MWPVTATLMRYPALSWVHGAGPRHDELSASAAAEYLDPAFGRRFAERGLDALAVVRGGRVLDVACGTGIFARLAAHVVGPAGRAVGVDPSPPVVEAARRIDLSSIAEWHDWDTAGLPFPDGSFDVVACQHALHRFDDPVRALRDMRRVLAPGGRLGLTTWGPIEENPVFAAQLDATVKSGLGESGVVEALLDAFSHHRADDLRAMVHRAGFRDVSCRTVRMLAALPRVAQWVRVTPRCRRSHTPGATATNSPASSSCRAPRSCCDPSSTTGCSGSRPRRVSSWRGTGVTMPAPGIPPGGTPRRAWPGRGVV